MDGRLTASGLDDQVNMRIAARIAEFRGDVPLTQRELALKLGVTETTIANWENGRRSLEWLVRSKKLCDALKCDLKDLVKEEGDEPTFEELRELYRAGKLQAQKRSEE
jgi:transcriptional regulator with XRE-family HTH domain